MARAALIASCLALAACAVEPGRDKTDETLQAAQPDRTVSSSDPMPSLMPQSTAPTPDCPITGSSDWRAWVNAMPGTGRPKLIVVGNVQVPGGNHLVVLKPGSTRESYPPVQVVELRVTPPGGGFTGGLVQHEARVEMAALDAYGSVVVQCGARTLATIDHIVRAQ